MRFCSSTSASHGRPARVPSAPSCSTLVGLAAAADVRVERMSKGMQQRLGIAQALVGDPQPAAARRTDERAAIRPGSHVVRGLLAELRRRGVAVLLNTHLLAEVERVCDRVAIIDHGRIVAAGTPDELGGARGVVVETERGEQRYPSLSRDDVPALVEKLVAGGERVYAVREERSTLEAAYLAAVAAAEGGAAT